MYKYSRSTRGFYLPGFHASIPADAVDVTEEGHAALLAGEAAGKRIEPDANGYPVLLDPPGPTPQQMIAAGTQAIQAEMDRLAQAKGYDNIVSACSYAAQAPGAPFQAEGQAFLDWRSLVWTNAYAVLAQVQAGQATLPTPEEAVAAMPALVLPA